MTELKQGQPVTPELDPRTLEDRAFFGNPHPTEYRPWGNPDAEIGRGQAVYGPLHDMFLDEWQEAQAIARIGRELADMVPVPPLDPLNAECIDTRIEPVVAQEGGEGQMKSQRETKKRALRQKEKAPKQYSEMLVVVNDLQLLSSADDEAIGAFMKYLSANRGKITHLVVNGDLADFEAQTGFSKQPDEMGSGVALDEIEAVRWFIERTSAYLPNAEKVLLWGNHEQRFFNMMKDRTDGVEAWVKPPSEMFGLRENGWREIPYGQNQYYEWHDRIFWHGHRAGAKSDIAKLELQDTGLVSTTTGHVNRNMYHEERDARGRLSSGITHGGFSKDSLGFMKKANTGWSQGFGVYYWDKKTGEQPYSVIMKHGNPMFISPDGVIYDGSGFNLREEIGLDPKRRGRPRK